jgi:polyisoprenoid-binding protein YceI
MKNPERWRAYLLGATLLSAGVNAAPYVIDPVETKATFETRFVGIIPILGTFKHTTGTLEYDTATRKGGIRAVIDAATLRTQFSDNGMTDRLLRSEAFFDVEKYPGIEFVSSGFRWENDKLVAIDGMLTLRAIARPATLAIARSHCVPGAPEKPARCEATAQFVIKRSDYGMSGWSATVADEVKINVDFVAVLDTPLAPTPTAVSTAPNTP